MDDKIKNRFYSHIIKTPTCWIWKAYKTKRGYGNFTITGKSFRAHRVSYEIHKGNIPQDLIVCHSCDNPSCVNPDHLWLGTYADNVRDRDLKGRQSKGDNHWLRQNNKKAIKAKKIISERQKGINNSFFGKKHTKDSLEKIRQASLGVIKSPETILKLKKALTGRVFSKETRKNMSIAQKGKKVPLHVRQKISKSLKGRIFSKETRKKMSIARLKVIYESKI